MSSHHGKFHSLGGRHDEGIGTKDPLRFWHLPCPLPGDPEKSDAEKAIEYINTENPFPYRRKNEALAAFHDQGFVRQLLETTSQYGTTQAQIYMGFKEGRLVSNLRPLPGRNPEDLEERLEKDALGW